MNATQLEPNEYISATRELFTTFQGIKVQYCGDYNALPSESYATLTQAESENLARESARLAASLCR